MGYDVSDFEKDVIERSRTIPVLVDFWADWCGPCKILGPVLERLAGQSDGTWALAKVDTEQQVEVAQQYGIQSIPNVKLFIDGVVVNEFVGALPEYQVRRWLETAIPGKHQKKLEQAEAFLAAGQFTLAQGLLEETVVLEPESAVARVLLARSIVFSEPAKAAGLIENIEEPKYLDFLEAIRTFARLHTLSHHTDQLPDGAARALYISAVQSLVTRDFDAALGQFIAVIRQDRYYDDDGSRRACIAIFKLLGEEHELTLKHRREFSSALY
jgi:putative thioredoxin